MMALCNESCLSVRWTGHLAVLHGTNSQKFQLILMKFSLLPQLVC